MCTQYIDPPNIDTLIALDKGEDAVRPIGVEEVIRRISLSAKWIYYEHCE